MKLRSPEAMLTAKVKTLIEERQGLAFGVLIRLIVIDHQR